MSDTSEHIGSARLQAYLEGEVEAEGRAAIETHLSGCPRCSEEAEAWTALFRELGSLPALTPSAAFEARVLSAIRPAPATAEAPAPERRSLPGRLRALLPKARPGRWSHPSSSLLQDLVEGLLPSPEAARIRTHLAGCAACEAKGAAWGGLMAAFTALPSHTPSPGFGTRVMRELQARGGVAPAPAPARLERFLTAARALLPTSRRGRLIAGGLVTAPAAGVAALAAFVVLHPLLSLGDLLAFVGWQGGAMARAAFSRVAREVIGSGTFFQLYEGLQLLLASPSALAAAVALGWTLTLSAGWVLYRNLVAPTLASRPHVRAS